MVWKQAFKVAVAAGEALVKGFSRAVREELKATQQSASAHASRTGQSTSDAREMGTANAKMGISLDESMQILNVKPPIDVEEVEKRYKHLFEINDKKKGGSFYLQSKVYRAKERIDEELRRQGQTQEKSTAPEAETQAKQENSK